MDFRPLSPADARVLLQALRGNANGEGATLLMDAETTFAGTSPEIPTDEEVVNAIKSVPTHYGA